MQDSFLKSNLDFCDQGANQLFGQSPEDQKTTKPSDQDFSNALNDDFCFYCKKEGELLCCDNCPRTYHNSSQCINPSYLEMVDEQNWICPCCRLREICPICENSVRQQPQIICSLCCRYVHYECVGLPKTLLDTNIASTQSAILIVCIDCMHRSGIQQWISKKQLEANIYCLVAPLHSSIIHKTWILKENFNQIMTNQTYRPLQATQTMINKWGTAEKILIMKTPIRDRDKDPAENLNKIVLRQEEYGNIDNFRFLVKWCGVDVPTWEDQVLIKGFKKPFYDFVKLQAFELALKGIKRNNLLGFLQRQESQLTESEVNLLDDLKSRKNLTLVEWKDQEQNQQFRKKLIHVIDEMVKDFLFQQNALAKVVVILTDSIQAWDISFRTSGLNTMVTKFETNSPSLALTFQYELSFTNSNYPRFNILLTDSQFICANRQLFSSQVKFDCQLLIFDETIKQQEPSNTFQKIQFLQNCSLVILKYCESQKNVYEEMFGQLFISNIQKHQNKMIEYVHQPQVFYQPEPLRFAQRALDPIDDILCLLRKPSTGSSQKINSQQMQVENMPIITSRIQSSPPKQVQKKTKDSQIEQAQTQTPKKPPSKQPRQKSIKQMASFSFIYKQFFNSPYQTVRKFTLNQAERLCLLCFTIAFGFNYTRAELFNKLLAFDKMNLFTQNLNSVKMDEIGRYLELIFAISTHDKGLGANISSIKYIFHGFNHRSLARHYLDLDILDILLKKYKDKPKKWPFTNPFIVEIKKNSGDIVARNWNEQDDLELIRLVLHYGFGDWNSVAENFRSSKQGQQKGVSYLIRKLNPHFKRTPSVSQLIYCVRALNSRIESLILQSDKYINL